MTPSDTTRQGAEPREDGWIDFVVGSPCPVLLQDRVEVRFRNGQGRLGQAGAFRWSARDDTDGYDIIAYRVVSPAPAAPTNGGGEPGLESVANGENRMVVVSAMTAMTNAIYALKSTKHILGSFYGRDHDKRIAELTSARDRFKAALQPQPNQQGGAGRDGRYLSAVAGRMAFRDAYRRTLPVVRAAEALAEKWTTPGQKVDSDDFYASIAAVCEAVLTRNSNKDAKNEAAILAALNTPEARG